MLGFKVRVATLKSLLSNKNLWSGEECGRKMCRTYAQDDEMKEPCTLRNIIYESECAKCNPAGSRKEQDKKGLEDKRHWMHIKNGIKFLNPNKISKMGL